MAKVTQIESLKSKPLFKYQVTYLDGRTQQLNLQAPPSCNGVIFMCKLENDNELILVLCNILSLEMIEAPKGSSELLGLDGKPLDTPKTFIQG